jgi:hypothetical protein
MHSALLIATWPVPPLPDPGLEQEWAALLARVRAVKNAHAGVEELLPGAWQVPVDADTRPLVAMCRAVDGDPGKSRGYRLLFFPVKPGWLVSPAQQV